MTELAIGSEFAGHRIESVAGRGGQGVVYVATHLALERRVALKIIAPQYAQDPEFRERFKRESRIAASINHPNVIPIYHAGEENGLLYITMYFVEGTDLKGMIAGGGALEPRLAAELVAQIAAGLDAAHARGLVHRDVKPANVVIDREQGGYRAYLTDFGLVKEASSQTSGLTQTGMFVGTLDYIAPEQLQGQPLDARTDVYALGCVLFQSLTGQVPYPRDTEAAKVWAHMGEPPPSVARAAPTVSAEFEAIVGRAMAKDPAVRFPSAGDLGRAALAAAEQRAVAEPERSVAVGDAAPGAAFAAAPPGATAIGAPDWTQAAGAQAPPTGGYPGVPGTTSGGYPGVPGTTSGGYAPAPPSRSRRALWFAIGGTAAAAAVAIGVLALVLGGGSDEPAEPVAGAVVGEPIEVGDQPLDMSADDDVLWVANLADGTVTRIDEDSGDTREIEVEGGAPSPIQAGEGAVWTAAFAEQITRIDPATNETRSIDVPAYSSSLQFDSGEGALWMLDQEAGHVIRIDAETDEVSEPIEVGEDTSGIAVGEGFVFVARSGGEIVFISPESNEVVGEPFEVGASELGGLGFTDGRLYVPARSREMYEVDVSSGVVGEPIPFGRGASSFDVGEGSIWVTYTIDGTVKRFDLETRKQVGKPIEVERSPQGVIVGDESVWVAHPNQDVVTRIDPSPDE